VSGGLKLFGARNYGAAIGSLKIESPAHAGRARMAAHVRAIKRNLLSLPCANLPVGRFVTGVPAPFVKIFGSVPPNHLETLGLPPTIGSVGPRHERGGMRGTRRVFAREWFCRAR